MSSKKVNFQEQVLKELDEFQRVQFVFFYRQNYKKLGVAYLWLIFFGVFGIHKLYLNKRIGWFYLLFCWTLIPALLAVVDIFLLPFQVKKYNKNLSIHIFELIRKLSSDSNTQLLIIDRKLKKGRVGLPEWVLAFAIIFGVITPAIAYASMRLTAHKLEIHYKTNHFDGSQSDLFFSI